MRGNARKKNSLRCDAKEYPGYNEARLAERRPMAASSPLLVALHSMYSSLIRGQDNCGWGESLGHLSLQVAD